MIDTRPAMTRAQFEEAAAYAYPGHWLTGEEHFLHVPAVMQVDGWNVYESSGNTQLTEPQRVLMMWSDLVGQTANGGFEQFVYNFRHSLALAYQLIGKLAWPALFERFDRAFREQAGDPSNPQPRAAAWGPADDAAVAAVRARIIRELALAKTRLRPWARAREIASLDRFSDTILHTWYNAALESGEIRPSKSAGEEAGQARPDEPATEASEAFDDWFYRDETKEESKTFIGRYIRTNRDGLCRLTG